MKISMKILYVPLLTGMLAACGDNDNDVGDIVEVARADGRFTTLVTALETTQLDAVLADRSSNFTVFAPTDEAFAKLNPADLNSLLNDPDALSDILLYHVLPDATIDSSAAIAAAGTTLTTANTDDIGVALKGGNLFINSSEVIVPDVATSNGIIHAIDTVLIPVVDDPLSGNIAQVALSAGSFSTLLDALATTGLDSVLTNPAGKFTVFAPTDAAFAKLGDISGLSTDELSEILLYHVIVGREVNASAAIAVAGNTVQMSNTSNDSLALSLSGADLFANLSRVSGTDVDASNGIIHAIDSVLMPPQEAATPTLNIVETAVSLNPEFSTLVGLLQDTGLDATLANANAQFTVFAPTNAAFAKLGDISGFTNDQLSAILTKHVVSGTVDSLTAYTLNGTDVATVNSETVALSITPDEFFVDNSKVTRFDVQATNGIIHVIDTVIALD